MEKEKQVPSLQSAGVSDNILYIVGCINRPTKSIISGVSTMTGKYKIKTKDSAVK